MRALITGGTGFIGSNLSRKLVEKGWEVFLITQKSFGYDNIKDIKDKVHIFEYNGQFNLLMKYIQEINVDVVFHLASVIITEHKYEDLYKILNANIVFGTEILEAMKYSKTKILINTGTYWQHYNQEEYNPVDLYSATKEAFEKIIKYYVEVENIRAINLKLFDTYGENDVRPKLINLLNKFADEEKELDMSLGEQKLDLVHIDDIISAYEKAYEYLKENINLKYETYAVSSGKRYSLKEIIEIFENISGKKIKINWGRRPYRKREVMIPWSNYNLLPNWECKIDIKEGLTKVIKK